MNQRGFTILEVLVGAAVAILVIGIVMATFLSQQKSMQSMDLSREASNGARDSMFSMQGSIGRAGYGVDPRYAFDFKWYNCTSVPCRAAAGRPAIARSIRLASSSTSPTAAISAHRACVVASCSAQKHRCRSRA